MTEGRNALETDKKDRFTSSENCLFRFILFFVLTFIFVYKSTKLPNNK